MAIMLVESADWADEALLGTLLLDAYKIQHFSFVLRILPTLHVVNSAVLHTVVQGSFYHCCIYYLRRIRIKPWKSRWEGKSKKRAAIFRCDLKS